MNSNIEVILNSNTEDLIKELKAMNLGTLQSFRNQFIIIYETQRHLKDAILDKINKGEITPEESETTLNNLYLYLQKVEDVVMIANEVIDDRGTLTEK